jgi:hypothetical protein
MKIGLLVDGRAEYQGLPHLLERLRTEHTILQQPLLCDIQPFASPMQMALAASKKFPILLHKEVDSIIILVDKETRPDCTVELAKDIEREAARRLAKLNPGIWLHVVLKVTTFENWLVADPQALRELSGLFSQTERIERQVSANRADSVNALELLKGCSRQKSYDKIEGAVAICKKLDPERAAASSRSFRKLLKTLGHSRR